jgi:hypothetical protein
MVVKGVIRLSQDEISAILEEFLQRMVSPRLKITGGVWSSFDNIEVEIGECELIEE